MKKRLAWALFGVYVLAWLPGGWYDSQSYQRVGTWDVVWAISFLAFALTGLVLALRVVSNPVGWLLMIGVALLGAGVSAEEYIEALDIDPQTVPSLVESLFPLGLLALFAAFILFPEGRYPNRWFIALHIIALGLLPFASAIWPEEDGGPAVVINLALPLLALVYRLVRGDGVVRRQVAAPLIPITMGLALVALISLLPGLAAELSDAGAVLAVTMMTVGAPIGITVAVTRYRLYDIDRLVSRTISYALVVSLLVSLFVAGVVWIPSAFGVGDSPLLVAASTLVVAALFNPLRKRVQVWVDRRFNRSRYDAERVADQFAGSLRDRVDPNAVVEDWLGVVSETMQPSAISVWVRNRS